MESTRHNTVTVSNPKEVCDRAAVKYVGVQQRYGSDRDLILFQPLTGALRGTTLAVPVGSEPVDILFKIEDEARAWS